MSVLMTALGLGATAVDVMSEGVSLLDRAAKVKEWLSTDEAAARGVPEVARLHRYPVGRDTDLRDIFETLKSRSQVAIVKGMGGVGKTTLARLYLAKHGRLYKNVGWLNAETPESLINDILPLAGRIQKFDVPRGTPEAQAKAVLQALPAKWLLIYDNAPGYQEIRDLMPPVGRAHILVTSRAQKWGGTFGQVEPSVLPVTNVQSDGVRLLVQESLPPEAWALVENIPDPDVRLSTLVERLEKAGLGDEAVSLAQRLGGLPLGLVITGALIREEGDGFADWENRLNEVLGESGPEDYGTTIKAAVKLSYDRLSADARRVVDLFAWFAPEGLSAQLLTDVPGSWIWEKSPGHLEPIDDDLRAFCGDPGRVTGALRELSSRSLILRGDDGYDMHRLTADALRALRGGATAEVARQAAAVLAAAYPGGSRSPAFSENWPQCRRLTPHVLAYRRAVAQDAPVISAVDYLYHQASIYLGEQGQFDPALDMARESLRLIQARLGPEHADIALGHSMLGLAYLDAGQAARGLEELRIAVELREAHDHGVAAMATGLNNLASVLRQLGRETGNRALLEEALAVDMRALALKRAEYGAVHESVAVTLSNIATSHDALGGLAAAIDWARQALEVYRDVLTPEDVRMGFTLTNLGAYLLKDGQAREAVGLLEDALSVWRAHLSADHPNVRNTASFLVSARIKSGRESEAQALADAYDLDWDERLRMAAQYPDPID